MEIESEPACNQQFSWINQKPMMRTLPAPCSISMAQSSDRGACGFVLTANPAITFRILTTS
jgi:hypothetical protein